MDRQTRSKVKIIDDDAELETINNDPAETEDKSRNAALEDDLLADNTTKSKSGEVSITNDSATNSKPAGVLHNLAGNLRIFAQSSTTNNEPLFTLEQVRALLGVIPGISLSMLTSSSTSNPGWHVRDCVMFTTPTLKICEYKDNKLLSACGNFKSWDQMVQLELSAANLVKFIKELRAHSLTIMEDQRNALNKHILQYFKACVSKHIWNYIQYMEIAAEVYVKISKLYTNTPTQDIVQINCQFQMVRFRPGFDKLLNLCLIIHKI